MVADYEAGMSAYELADTYGHHRDTIMKYLAKAGIRSRVAVPSDEEIFRWKELHAEGLGFKTIARRVGRNHKTVRKYIRTLKEESWRGENLKIESSPYQSLV